MTHQQQRLGCVQSNTLLGRTYIQKWGWQLVLPCHSFAATLPRLHFRFRTHDMKYPCHGLCNRRTHHTVFRTTRLTIPRGSSRVCTSADRPLGLAYQRFIEHLRLPLPCHQLYYSRGRFFRYRSCVLLFNPIFPNTDKSSRSTQPSFIRTVLGKCDSTDNLLTPSPRLPIQASLGALFICPTTTNRRMAVLRRRTAFLCNRSHLRDTPSPKARPTPATAWPLSRPPSPMPALLPRTDNRSFPRTQRSTPRKPAICPRNSSIINSNSMPNKRNLMGPSNRTALLRRATLCNSSNSHSSCHSSSSSSSTTAIRSCPASKWIRTDYHRSRAMSLCSIHKPSRLRRRL